MLLIHEICDKFENKTKNCKYSRLNIVYNLDGEVNTFFSCAGSIGY